MKIIKTLHSLRAKFYNLVFRIYPIKQNKVLFMSYYGSQYGCNPKYISEELVNSSSHIGNVDVVWVFNDKSKLPPQGCRVVKNASWKFFFELSTAKCIVTNFRLTADFEKKTGQCYVQTWHSSLRLKNIEKDAIETLPQSYVNNAQDDSKKIDLLLSGCKASTDIFNKAFWYNGEILEKGTPRNDILLESHKKHFDPIRKKLNLSKNQNVLLYAPTFRKNYDISPYNINFDALTIEVTKKYGGDWIILQRFHPHMICQLPETEYSENVQDVTEYDDIQELLMVADVLVTDYSALMFDFLYTNKPCILFASDLDVYTTTNRKLYFDIHSLPYPVAQSNDQLIEIIRDFDKDMYRKEVLKFKQEIGSFESGNASAAVCNYITEKIKNDR